MNETAENGIGKGRFREVGMSGGNRGLSEEEGGGVSKAAVQDLEQVLGL